MKIKKSKLALTVFLSVIVLSSIIMIAFALNVSEKKLPVHDFVWAGYEGANHSLDGKVIEQTFAFKTKKGSKILLPVFNYNEAKLVYWSPEDKELSISEHSGTRWLSLAKWLSQSEEVSEIRFLSKDIIINVKKFTTGFLPAKSLRIKSETYEVSEVPNALAVKAEDATDRFAFLTASGEIKAGETLVPLAQLKDLSSDWDYNPLTDCLAYEEGSSVIILWNNQKYVVRPHLLTRDFRIAVLTHPNVVLVSFSKPFSTSISLKAYSYQGLNYGEIAQTAGGFRRPIYLNKSNDFGNLEKTASKTK